MKLLNLKTLLLGLVCLVAVIGTATLTADLAPAPPQTTPAPLEAAADFQPAFSLEAILAESEAAPGQTMSLSPVPVPDPVVTACNFWSAIACRGLNVGDSCSWGTCRLSGTWWNGCVCD